MLEEYCKIVGVPITGVRSKLRKRNVLYPRYVFWNIMRKRGYSFSVIGNMTGHDHCTVMHGIKELSGLIKYPDIKELMEKSKKFEYRMSIQKEMLEIKQPDYEATEETIMYGNRPCIHCHGEGGFTDETGRDEHTFKICPVCKGKGLVQPVVTVVWNSPENAPLTRLAQESVS